MTKKSAAGFKVVALVVMVFVVVLAADAAYGMGSKGGGRDRSTVVETSGANQGDSVTGDAAASSDAPAIGVRMLGTTLAVPVPEPLALLLVGSGLVGLAGIRRRFKR